LKFVLRFNAVKDSDYEIPEELSQVLRGYQVYGYKWLRTLAGCGFGGILADEMGLGKTLQIIAVLLAEKQEGSIGTSLIICPASLVYNWAEEFHRFAPELTVCPVEGNQAERGEIIERSGKWDVLISSYDHLKRDVQAYEGKVFLYEVLDEAQFIKNQSTASAKAVKVIRSKHRFALTGTPIENRLSELWSIFDFLMPGFLYRYETFRKEME
jgi:SNF2 family DNA or RNA helicase